MATYLASYSSSDYLEHHGIKGQKWGVRRYQNEDGTLTDSGKLRDRAANKFTSTEKNVEISLTTEPNTFKKKQLDISTVKARGNLTDAEAKRCATLANKKFSRAEKVEPKITSDVITAVKNAGCKLFGLDNRLKQPTSLAAKIGSDAKEDDISFREAAAKIKDSIRYTSVSDEETFTKNYEAINKSLEDAGYTQTRCKNYFQEYHDGNAMHKSVQCTYKNSSGDTFELQFQTVASQAAKELKTPLYEEIRTSGVSDSRAYELKSQMRELAERVADPPDVFTIGKKEDTMTHYMATYDSDYLEHHGIKGQKWGVRRYQNEDGSYTALGAQNGGRYSGSTNDTEVRKKFVSDLSNEMDTKWSYGVMIDGKKVLYDDAEIEDVDWSKYRTTPISELEKTKTGNCWDMTNYEYAKLKEKGMSPSAYMLTMQIGKTKDDMVTHTFVTYYDDEGKNHWIESAYWPEHGVHDISSPKDVADTISDHYGKKSYNLYKYDPTGMDQGLNDQEYFDKATSMKWKY